MIKTRRLAVLLGTVFLLSGIASAQNTERKTAILVEGYSLVKCHGLDCPPWPVPPDGGFCFQVGDNFYAGFSRQWGVPWANKVKKLLALQGKSVDIAVTEKQIVATALHVKLRLDKVHQDCLFRLPACRQT